MLEMDASFSMYMFHGGTNFGFTNGANHTLVEYQPTITSYDYGCPLSEAGDMTPTYYALRDALAEVNNRYEQRIGEAINQDLNSAMISILTEFQMK